MRKDYAVLHIAKYKGLRGIGAHIDRKHLSENVNRDLTYLNDEIVEILGDYIDVSKSFLREDLVSSKYNDLEKDVKQAISEGYKSTNKIRSNAVLALGVIMTGSHERMKEIEGDDKLFGLWKAANYSFACKEFGKDNIVRFTLHRDERTPHFHCVYVPIIEGRLSARDCLGGGLVLKGIQDRYAEAMSEFGLSRGISSGHKAVHHISTRDYYRSLREKKARVSGLLEKVSAKNVLSLDKVKHSISREIDTLITQQVEQEIELSRLSRRSTVYSETIKTTILRDLDIVKRTIDLVNLGCNMGYVIDKVKSSKTYVTLKKEEEVLVVKCPISSPYWQYFSVTNSEDKGTTVDFMLNRGYNYKEIRKLLDIVLDDRYISVNKSLPETTFSTGEQTKRVLFKLEKFGNSLHSEDYLSSRGIPFDVWSKFSLNDRKEEIIKSKVNEAIFGLYKDFNDKGEGYLCSTILYKRNGDGRDGKYFQRGLPRGIVVLGNISNCDNVMVTESPLDALSHKSLYPETNHAYLSTCGSLSKSIKHDLQTLAKLASLNSKEVVLSFDNDQVGKEMSNSLSELLKQEGVECKIKLPDQGKDWNSLLLGKFSSGMNILKSLLFAGSDGSEEDENEDKEKLKKFKRRI